ncbi:tRNA uridine-5-carboxymethylaminomethyl(34) synthesis GTPase MnmE [Acidibrevibacterium fodinaquatile]|uniref:tRNA uridine-5-carboxymethylaminomethyl(34) synthesis GTPase MnmE n=1 Tax=Acidibrevibacterium fodinaquatile TaxID=1969806 RepID=UPI000E0D0376|nr:tRNA uridine-5-carboxymethylaminomethyl(34) synthesis GTPase MnmE [Acidibrevibacterium fodinaquatile]
MAEHEDTIFALASGGGRTAVAVLRISGEKSGALLDALCGRRPPPRRASLRRVRDASGETLDQALALWLPGPGTYTGEDSAELHLHGGPAVIEAVAEALIAAGARPAEAGEFTRRAFFNGRMDLTAAEAVADLVEAESAEQRRQALRQMEGALGALYEDWSQRLMRVLAQQEALIDFPDEDLPADVARRLATEMATLAAEIAAHLNDNRRGERTREGLRIAIIGPPNVGKSSLINRLLARDVAIVSDLPGTTRDALEARLVLGGMVMTVIDTAGLRETEDRIEAEGVRRARARAAEADIVLAMHDASQPEAVLDAAAMPHAGEVILVANKLDLASGRDIGDAIGVSALTGQGLERLSDALIAAGRRLTARTGPPPLTRPRHRAALEAALAALTRAMAEPSEELRGEELRIALRMIGRVTGRWGVEEILGEIFSRFCIGK